MINNSYTFNYIQTNEPKYKLIRQKLDISSSNNRIKNVKINNISNKSNALLSDISYITNDKSIKKNISLKYENLSLNNISSLSPQNNIEKLPIFKNHFKKQKNFLNKGKHDKYSNVILFENRMSKHILFLNRKEFNSNKNINSSENKLSNSKKNILTPKKYNNLNNYFLTPRTKIKSRNYELSKNYSCNYINYFALPNSKREKYSTIILPRINRIFFFPKNNSPKTERNSSLKLNKEKEKLVIKQNLKKLFKRLNKKIMPKKRNILNSYKIPYILNKNKDIDNKKEQIPNSCIHRNEYGNFIVFEKTHLDGLEEEKIKEIEKKKIIRKYNTNEGYIDLKLLNRGNNKSYKTNLRCKDGIYFYEFNKCGRIETVEERVHRIKRDNIGLIKLLEKFDKNKLFKNIENIDYEINIKKIYEAQPSINKNIYKDLYHMLIKK